MTGGFIILMGGAERLCLILKDLATSLEAAAQLLTFPFLAIHF